MLDILNSRQSTTKNALAILLLVLYIDRGTNASSRILGINVRPTNGRNSSPLADCNRPEEHGAGRALTFAIIDHL